MKLKFVGFSTMPEENQALVEQIKSLGRRKAVSREEASFFAYMKEGTTFVCMAGTYSDFIDPESHTEGFSILSDGLYVWTSAYAYYLRTYSLDIPSDFFERAKSNDFKAPLLSREEEEKVDKAIMSGEYEE